MSVTSSIQPNSSWDEADQLISILRTWGIGYLVGEDHPISPSATARDQQSAVTLIRRLAQCEYPRVRDASISLFLLHPELAPAILEAIQTSEPTVAEQITTLVLATLYLQRLWSLRLIMALGHEPSFPEQPFAHLWKSRHLPPLSSHDGKWGLLALQEAEQRRTDLPFTFIGDWQNQVNHLLLQEEAYHRHFDAVGELPIKAKRSDGQCVGALSEARFNSFAPAGWGGANAAEFANSIHFMVPTMPLAVQNEPDQQEWIRPSVDKARIETFFQQLGQTFHKPGHLYVGGGAALVHMGIRSGPTQGIDVEISGNDEGEMIEAIRRLIQQLNINIELASPRDFMPLPKHWMTQSQYVGRYGSVDVFYFDFYSIALSKMERGNTRDINDVKLLLEQGIITLQGLDTAYKEVLAQMGKGTYARLDPRRFAERYAAVRQLL